MSVLIFLLLYFWMVSDYSKGFGGKYGVQSDRVDKSALGYDHQEKLEKHESQKGIRFVKGCYWKWNFLAAIFII